MRILSSFAAGVAALALATSAYAETASGAFRKVMDDQWAWSLKQSPTFATTLGVRDYDEKLDDPSLEAYDADAAQSKAILSRLDAIDRTALADADKINYELLKLQLSNDVEAARFGGKYLAISGRGGPHTFIAGLPDDLPFFTRADYASYVARLKKTPAYFKAVEERLAAGVKAGWVQPCVIMERFESSVSFHAVDGAEKSALYRPFDNKPAAIAARDWKALKADAKSAIEKEFVPALRAFGDFYRTRYAPHCRKSVGLSDLPGGRDFYEHRARMYTTTAMKVDDIHALGLSEVARIRKEMDALISESGFKGDFKAFQKFLREDPRFYAKTPEELMKANALVAKRMDGEMPKLFGKLPRMPYTLKEVPADIAEGTTTAYYERPSGDGARAGVYRVNTSKLNQRPLYEIEALTLHEAVPGHHHQIALAQELDLPPFRRFGFFTAFSEGWGLYAESLGLEAGFYKDPYSNFGRLSYEMWRACRLVVDTGIHAKGWTKEQAVAFMQENTALSDGNIDAEVNRYIGNGGQALAYKIGELKIKELRARAAKALGSKFDVRRFHDAVLDAGALPLSVLEQKIDAWIAAEKAR